MAGGTWDTAEPVYPALVPAGALVESHAREVRGMSLKQVLLWNSMVWAVALVAAAVLIGQRDDFLGLVLVLICGAVASDAVISRLTPEA